MTIRDAMCLLLFGLLLPVLFLAVTGSPLWLAGWLLLWIVTTVMPR